jgi:hypothetical protein
MTYAERLFGLVLLLGLTGLHAQEESSGCGPVAIPGWYGPYDYVTQNGKLPIVEQHHFTPKVEALLAGQEGTIGGDISYTLNASPNHHRALVALMKFGAKTKSPQPPGVLMSIECYFERATRFKPDDTVVRTLFGLYLAQVDRMPEAMKQFNAADHYANDNAFSRNNIGLALFELKQYEAARRQAHLAAKLGFPATLLVDKLKGVNQWKEPTE